MKKIALVSLLVASMLAPAGLAFAEPICGVDFSCDNGSPEMVVNAWGGTNSDVPHVQPGQSVTDQWGTVLLCPAWFTNYCVDISHTQYYISRHV